MKWCSSDEIALRLIELLLNMIRITGDGINRLADIQRSVEQKREAMV